MWSEQVAKLLPELFNRYPLVIVVDADLMVSFICLRARHFLNFPVKICNKILLDLGLYRLINQKGSLHEMVVSLTNILATNMSGSRSMKILLRGWSPSSNLKI